MNYFCEKCNKNYKSYKSFWCHNKIKHDNKEIEEINKKHETDTNKCRHCGKTLANRHSRWRHEKNCFSNKINKLEEEIKNLKTKPQTIINNNINNNINNINNGTVNNFLIHPGSEDINLLTNEEVEYIMDQQFNCIVALIDKLYFNKELAKNHIYCTTDLNNKYVSTINPETLAIEKQRKKDFYDTLLWNGIKTMKKLYEKIKHKNTKKAIEYKQNIDKLVDFLTMNDKGKKTFVELVNALSFNKRDIVQATWISLKNNIIPQNQRVPINDKQISNKIMEIKNESITNELLEEQTPKRRQIIPLYESSDSEISEDEDDDEENKIIIKKKQYIIDGENLYIIDSNGKRGDLYGFYKNGKVIKNKEIEL
jgi:hypothetical protein